jgi:predicted Zn-dependent peptidase
MAPLNEDRTNYFEALPSNQLRSWRCTWKQNRMRSLAVTQENLDNQRNAVQEERRIGLRQRCLRQTRRDSAGVDVRQLASKHSTIGSMADLNAASVEDAMAFIKMYYAPNNATLTLVGDFKAADALKTARSKRTLRTFRASPDPPAVDANLSRNKSRAPPVS